MTAACGSDCSRRPHLRKSFTPTVLVVEAVAAEKVEEPQTLAVAKMPSNIPSSFEPARKPRDAHFLAGFFAGSLQAKLYVALL